MVGDTKVEGVRIAVAMPGDPALVIKNLSVRDARGLLAVDGVSLEVRSGEIVGIAGVAGNGQRALTDAVAGLESVESGTVTVMQADVTDAPPQQRFAAGLAYVPEVRLGVGRRTAASRHRERRDASSTRKRVGVPSSTGRTARSFMERIVEEFEVKIANARGPLAGLSGGNQRPQGGRPRTRQESPSRRRIPTNKGS